MCLDDELRLKTKALEKGLLMMGPLGNALINGFPLAFANQSQRNHWYISARNRIQEICCGIANRGGGRHPGHWNGRLDGKKEIGGLLLRVGGIF
jgi:FdrA protein